MAKYSLSTQPYKGTRDFYPEDLRLRNWLFNNMKKVCKSFGYEEYDGPMIESFDLYAAKTGEEIVNNEIYTFEDKGGRKVAIRPEMTPTVARMVAAKIYELPKPIKWFSIPNLWRYEAPQRGRLREHWQLNVDIFGVDSLDAELEIISIAKNILDSFGANEQMYECRVSNRKLLDAVLSSFEITDNDNLKHKVCKIIDKKEKVSPDDFVLMLKDAGCNSLQIENLKQFLSSGLEDLLDFVPETEIGYIEIKTLFELFSVDSNQKYLKFDPSLMRGFDYYTGTVFEFFDTDKTNKRSLFGGGRYDDLVSIFNGQKIPAVGFGMGDVTAKDFLEVHNILPKLENDTKVLVTIMDLNSKAYSHEIATKLRNMGLNVITYLNIDKLDKQLKYSNEKGIRYVVICGDLEISNKTFKIKDMDTRNEIEIKMSEIENLHLE